MNMIGKELKMTKPIEPAERIEEYYLTGARSILKSYEKDHEKGRPEAARVKTS